MSDQVWSNKVFIVDGGFRLRGSTLGYLHVEGFHPSNHHTPDKHNLARRKFLTKYTHVIRGLLSEGYSPGEVIQRWISYGKD